MARGCWMAIGMAAGLTACSRGSNEADYNNVRVDPAHARAQARIDRAAAAQGTRTVAKVGLPVSSPTPTAAQGRALPTAFQGYWGATPDDCALANVDARGRVAIDSDQLRFFERRAAVDTLRERSPTTLAVTLAYKGDGQRWKHDATLTLEQGGTRLLLVEQGDAVRPGQTMRYQRC